MHIISYWEIQRHVKPLYWKWRKYHILFLNRERRRWVRKPLPSCRDQSRAWGRPRHCWLIRPEVSGKTFLRRTRPAPTGPCRSHRAPQMYRSPLRRSGERKGCLTAGCCLLCIRRCVTCCNAWQTSLPAWLFLSVRTTLPPLSRTLLLNSFPNPPAAPVIRKFPFIAACAVRGWWTDDDGAFFWCLSLYCLDCTNSNWLQHSAVTVASNLTPCFSNKQLTTLTGLSHRNQFYILDSAVDTQQLAGGDSQYFYWELCHGSVSAPFRISIIYFIYVGEVWCIYYSRNSR